MTIDKTDEPTSEEAGESLSEPPPIQEEHTKSVGELIRERFAIGR